jgi:hypothetical protein
MTSSDFDQLRARLREVVKIADLLESTGHHIRRNGHGGGTAQHPFHEDPEQAQAIRGSIVSRTVGIRGRVLCAWHTRSTRVPTKWVNNGIIRQMAQIPQSHHPLIRVFNFSKKSHQIRQLFIIQLNPKPMPVIRIPIHSFTSPAALSGRAHP